MSPQFKRASPTKVHTCQQADCDNTVPAENGYCATHKLDADIRRAWGKRDRVEAAQRRAAFVAERDEYYRRHGVDI